MASVMHLKALCFPIHRYNFFPTRFAFHLYFALFGALLPISLFAFSTVSILMMLFLIILYFYDSFFASQLQDFSNGTLFFYTISLTFS